MYIVLFAILSIIVVFCHKYNISTFHLKVRILKNEEKSNKIYSNFQESMDDFINQNNINHYNELETDLEKLLSERYYLYKICNSSKIGCGVLKEGQKQTDDTAFNSHQYTLPYPININIITDSKKPCENNLLLFQIITKSSSFLERYTYRKIYSQYKYVKLYFAIGKSKDENINKMIKEENNKHDDIIQLDVYDNYFNIVYQTIGGMRWINQHCNNYKYLIEHSSDIYFNIPLFYKLYGSKSHTYPAIGNIVTGGRVNRNNTSQFYIPESVYNHTIYPNYMHGPCQIFSKKSITKIVSASHRMKLILIFDDVYIGFLMKISNINQIQSIYRQSIVFYSNKPKRRIKSRIIFFHPLKIGCIYYLSQ